MNDQKLLACIKKDKKALDSYRTKSNARVIKYRKRLKEEALEGAGHD